MALSFFRFFIVIVATVVLHKRHPCLPSTPPFSLAPLDPFELPIIPSYEMSSRPAKNPTHRSPTFQFQPFQNSTNINRTTNDPMHLSTGGGTRASGTKKKKKTASAKDVETTTEVKKKVIEPPTAKMASLSVVDDSEKEADVTAEDEDYSDLVPASAKTEHKTIDFNAESAEMDRIFEEQAAGQLKDLPDFQRPKRFRKKTFLYPHQLDGIRWLIKQERDPHPNPFSYTRTLKNGTVAGYDKFTKRRLVSEGHPPVRGTLYLPRSFRRFALS